MATVIEGRAPGAYIEQVFKQTDPPFQTGVISERETPRIATCGA